MARDCRGRRSSSGPTPTSAAVARLRRPARRLDRRRARPDPRGRDQLRRDELPAAGHPPPIWCVFADVLDEVDAGAMGCVPTRDWGYLTRAPPAGPDGGPPSPDWRMPYVLARLGDRRPGPRLGSPRHAVPFPRARPAAVRPVAPGITRAARQRRLELRRAPGRPRRRCHLQRDGPARVPPVPPGPRPGLPVRGLPVRPPRDPLVQPLEQARDACPFPRQRRSNPGLLRESGQPAIGRGAAAPADRQEMLRRASAPVR